MTKNCGQTDGSTSAIFDITVPDPNARFTAPFRIVRGSKNTGDARQRALGRRRQLGLVA